ncbi:MAG: efflux RND transporter permease subunit [Gemmataceae bacterium]
MFNLASWVRPYFSAVLLTVLLLTAGGIYSATRMPSGVYPEVTFPRIAVVARVAGLAVPNMEVRVTRPLEEAVSSVIGVAQVRSKTIRGGSEIYIDCSPGTDMRRAEELAWNRIGSIRSDLPPEVQLTVEQMTPSIFPIISVVLTGGENSSQLREYAFYQLAPQIKTIPDVLYANVAGGDVREIEVETRPDDLLAVGLSAADVADQISKGHRLQPVGRIEHPPFAFQLLVNTQAENATQIEELVIATKNNQPLRVRDVADVKVLHQDRVLSIGFREKDAVVITIFRRLGGNTLNISRDLRALLAKRPANNIDATIVYDQAQFVSTAVDNVRDAIIIGGLFSVLILLAFLRSWRATLISALAIPTTLAITFLFLHWIGETLNLMSLGGLAVAIGLIIDDTVVVIENIARHLAPEHRSSTGGQPEPIRRGDADPINAASGEITGAVIGSTLTTVLVFLPLAFIVGVYGQFFASLSWSLAIAVLVSMVISLTLVPVLAARFLAGRPMPPPGPIYRAIAHVYELVLGAALRVPWLTLGISSAAVAVGIILYTGIPSFWKSQQAGQPPPEPLVKGLQTGLMPAMDEGSFILDYWAPSGTPLDRTEKMVEEIEHILSENPDVESYVRRTGSENGIFATQSNRGDIQVVLRPAEEGLVSRMRKPVRPEKIDDELKHIGREGVRKKYRRRAIKDVMDEVEGDVKEHFAEHQLKIELVQIMRDELNDLSGASKPVEVKLFGPDYLKLRELAEQLGDALETKGKGHGIKEVNNNVHEGNPDLMIKVDAVKQTRLRLTPQEVERQLAAIYLGQVATQVRESAARITNVRVRYPDTVRFGKRSFNVDSVLNQMIFLPDVVPSGPSGPIQDYSTPLAGLGRAVSLGSVASIEPVRTPDEQWRENQQPAIFVTAEQNEEEGGLDEMVKVVQQEMNNIVLPGGYHWALGGHYIRKQEAFHSLLIVMVVAIFLVFIMLAFQFRSVSLPMLIFMTQPLSLLAGFFALWLTNTPLNISSAMGVILLIGLDMKNGILLVEYIQQLRKEGMELRPALLLAGRTRFRPILMTSLAAILGLFPLALGIGPGAQMQQPLAIMVIGGLTANMLFTRLIIPVGYLLMERSKAKELSISQPIAV